MPADPLWICPNPGATPRAAAEMFAHEYWPGQGRRVGPWFAGLRFRLEDGLATYRVDLDPTRKAWAVYSFEGD